MKRIGNLHCKITDRGNVELADRNARRGKSSNYGVRLHDRNREKNINELIAAMGDLTIRTSPYTEETISNGAKKRNISKLPYYPDLIRTHAESQVLAPLWRKVYPYNTYSCIPGRGISACAERVKKIIRKYDGKPLYALTTDIQKFYQEKYGNAADWQEKMRADLKGGIPEDVRDYLATDWMGHYVYYYYCENIKTKDNGENKNKSGVN